MYVSLIYKAVAYLSLRSVTISCITDLHLWPPLSIVNAKAEYKTGESSGHEQ